MSTVSTEVELRDILAEQYDPTQNSPEEGVTGGDAPADSVAPDASAVPDGGYGWVVVFACAVITWWFVGTTYSWGVIQTALVDQGLSGASTLSFVGSLTVAFIALLAIANARILTTIGARNAGLLGIGLLGLGEILGGFATKNIGALFATVGVVMGVGTRYCRPSVCNWT